MEASGICQRLAEDIRWAIVGKGFDLATARRMSRVADALQNGRWLRSEFGEQGEVGQGGTLEIEVQGACLANTILHFTYEDMTISIQDAEDSDV